MKCVYVSYDGLLDPLGQSQVVPYIQCLVAAGHSFAVLSYEKEQRPGLEIQTLERSLNKAGVEWIRLPFRAGGFEFAKRVIFGVVAVRNICGRIRPDIVHLRGFMPAVIYKLSLLRVPHLYDFRGFAIEEWTDIGKLRAGSLAHRVLRQMDHLAVGSACGLVVLEKPAESLLRTLYNVPNVPLKVIRTSTDVSLYKPRTESDADSQRDPIKFVCLGGARRPYRPDLALRFVAQLIKGGIDCRVDFINERDHADIISAAEEVSFPLDKLTVLRLDQRCIPGALENYACGLIFLDSSPWRRVCSPTKLGEYLAAGLPVISLDGIDVLEEFAMRTSCVLIVSQRELFSGAAMEMGNRCASFIRRPGVGFDCQEFARRECDLEMAGPLYAELYAEIEARL